MKRRQFLTSLAAGAAASHALAPLLGYAAAKPAPAGADLAFLSVHELAARLRRRELTAEAVTKNYLERIERLNPVINAFVLVNRDGALARARELDRLAAHGKFAGALHGVPIAIKDDLWTRDLPTTVGSKLLRGWRPPYDATALLRLRASGAVILGKTNLDEFTMGTSGRNLLFGATKNPYDLSRVPGGSSGGSAAAVASGLCAAALGSDSAGSVRVPAAACGSFGFKPTFGLFSTYGLTPLTPSKDVLGTITRCAADSRLLASVLAGRDPGDPSTADQPPWKEDRTGVRSAKGLRFGYVTEYTDVAEPAVRAKIGEAVESLRRAGAVVEPVATNRRAEATTAARNVSAVEFLTWVEVLLEGVSLELEPSFPEMDPVIARFLESFRHVSAEQYCLALHRTRPELSAYYTAATKGFDALLLPTSGTVPYPQEDPHALSTEPLADIKRRHGDFRQPSELAGLTGMPAVTLPAGLAAGGLPVGLQLLGTAWSDSRLLAIAERVEKALVGFVRPAIAGA